LNNAAETRLPGKAMKRHILRVAMCFVAAVISGAVFVIALFHQLALVELAASILTGLQVFF
jgi:hypothetical protein